MKLTIQTIQTEGQTYNIQNTSTDRGVITVDMEVIHKTQQCYENSSSSDQIKVLVGTTRINPRSINVHTDKYDTSVKI